MNLTGAKRVDPMNQVFFAYGKIHHVLFMGRQEALWENDVHVVNYDHFAKKNINTRYKVVPPQ